MTVANTEEEMQAVLKQLEQDGTVPDRIYSSKDIYKLEKEKIFYKAWTPIGHESEIAEPGDYIVRYVADDSYIVTRNEDGNIKAFANQCAHQGRQVCHGEMGNASHFRCPYHGWTYNNDGKLIGIPHLENAYQGNVNREEVGELRKPRLDTYDGLIFLCLSDETESLNDYLGDFKFYLDFYFGRSSGGMEFHGPQRLIKDTNWKIPVINNISDHYHSLVTHRSLAKTPHILPTPNRGGDQDSARYHIHAGPGGLEMKRTGGWLQHLPEEMHDGMQEALSEDHLRLMDETGYSPINCGLFPNFIVNTTAPIYPEDESRGVWLTYVMSYRPLGPTKSEAYIWYAIEKNAPTKYKQRAHRAFVGSFGSSGIADQDDGKNWMSVTEAAQGDTQNMRYDMQMETEPIDWDAPGTAYETWFNEANARHFLKLYSRYMTASENK